MVKIEDGYAENLYHLEKYKFIKHLTEEIFKGRTIVGDCCKILIYTPHSNGADSRIDCLENKISVRKKENYEKCLQLAEQCEKHFNEPFTLRTIYKTEHG